MAIAKNQQLTYNYNTFHPGDQFVLHLSVFFFFCNYIVAASLFLDQPAMILLKERLKLLRYFSIGSSKDLMRFISKNIKHPTDILHRGSFFSQLYDEVYYELALKHIKIQKKVLRIFEFLALPIEQHKENELIFCCNQIKKVRNEVYKEELKKKLKKNW